MDDLIALITESCMVSIPELSDKLNMSEDMVLARMERYEQLGYIKRVVEGGPSTGCSCNCGSCKGCKGSHGNSGAIVYWTKGERLE